MKKSLIALAALAAVSAASAQSSVSLSGLLDFGISSGEITTQTSNTATAAAVKANNTGAQNTFSTGQISISGTEDLGGGLKASFVVNSDITGLKFFATRDTSLALAGGFGTVRIGRFVPAAATGFHALSGSPSTAVGSIYGMTSVSTAAAARFGITTASDANSFERNNNTLQYTSPSFSGVTLNVNYGTSTSDSSILAGKLEATQSGLSVTYVNGPLIVAAGVNNRTDNAVGTSTTAVGDKVDKDLNWVGASYKLDAATLFASHVMSKTDTTVAAGTVTVNNDVKVTSYGVAVPMGAYTFNASAYTGKNGVLVATTDDTKLSGYQISARYALSKRTSAYALIGENQIKRDSGNTTGPIFKQTVSAIGLIHAF